MITMNTSRKVFWFWAFICLLLCPKIVDGNIAVANKTISLIVAVYYDIDMLSDVIRPVSPYISEIVIVDGPREMSMVLLEPMGLVYNESTSTVKSFFFNEIRHQFPDIKLVYRFKVWADEKEQRDTAFNLCSNPVVLMADADMFMHLSVSSLSQFLADPHKSVARVAVCNTFLSGGRVYQTVKPTEKYSLTAYPTQQPVMGKKSVMNAEEFFDNLWIIGVKQNGSKRHLQQFHHPVGSALHLTVHRSAVGMAIKYAFYASLPSNMQHMRKGKYLEVLQNVSALHGTSIAREVFLRARKESTCMFSSLMYVPFEYAHQDIVSKVQHWCDYSYLPRKHNGTGYRGHMIPLAQNYPSFISLYPTDVDGVCLVFMKVQSCTIDVFDVKLNQTDSWEFVHRVNIPNENKHHRLTAFVSFQPTKDRNTLIRRVLTLSCQPVQVPGKHIIGEVGRCGGADHISDA
jgi:hypothetical protein